jgi:hypothetical protein
MGQYSLIRFRFKENKMTISRKLDFSRSVKSNLNIMAAFLMIGFSMLSGCSHTEQVLVPPQMDLSPYRIIGIIEFSSNREAKLKQYVTQNYLQTVQNAQPQVRFLELGSQDLVLSKVSRKQLDYEAIKSIGRRYNVDAIIFGNLNLSEPKPKVNLSSTWQSLKVGADVEASLIAKLWETDSGVIRWTNSTQGKDSVAHLSASTGGNFHFGATDPAEAYGRLIPQLVYANTTDFRSHYEFRRVK